MDATRSPTSSAREDKRKSHQCKPCFPSSDAGLFPSIRPPSAPDGLCPGFRIEAIVASPAPEPCIRIERAPYKRRQPYDDEIERPQHAALHGMGPLMVYRCRIVDDDERPEADAAPTLPLVVCDIAAALPFRSPREQEADDCLRKLPCKKQGLYQYYQVSPHAVA